jgi:hypothetical protein
MSKQQPTNQQHRQRTIFCIFTADNIGEEKKKGMKMYFNMPVKKCRNETAAPRPTGEWKRK